MINFEWATLLAALQEPEPQTDKPEAEQNADDPKKENKP